MKSFESKDIRNIGLLSHAGAGKTTLAEAILFNAGASPRLQKVDDENSVFDFEPEEHKRRSTTKAGVANIEWNKSKVNVVDTPGVADFFSDTRQALFAVDGAVVLVSAADGVEVGTNRCWRILKETRKPTAIAVSKMDRAAARHAQILDEIRASISTAVVPLQLPIIDGSEFVGVVDLLHKRAFTFRNDESGETDISDIPAAMADEVDEARTQLVEGVAETDEVLLEKYFDEGDLSQEDLIHGFGEAFHSADVVPVFYVSGLQNRGVRSLMNEFIEIFPNPLEREPFVGTDSTGELIEVPAQTDGPMSAYVFKTLVDPYAGAISIMRVLTGALGGDGHLTNANTDESERYSALYGVIGKKTFSISRAAAGDIVALTKLKETRTGHTLTADPRKPVFEGLAPKEPVISFAVVPKTQKDEGKVSTALQRILLEDTALRVGRDEQSKHFLLSGMGQVHIETTVAKLARKFDVAVHLEPPRVPYKETIRSEAKSIQGRHKKQTGGAGQFGEVFIDLSPNERGAGFEFVDNIVGGAVPRNYVPAVEKGLEESMARGYLAGYPVVDVKVRLYDGSYHSVDSNEMAFKMAASLAFKAAMAKANGCLLEPIMEIEVTVPEESMGDVMGDMNGRRGRVSGMDSQGAMQIIRAQVPLAEVLRYAPDLKSMTSGRGEFHLEFSHYDVVPDHLADKVIQEAKEG